MQHKNCLEYPCPECEHDMNLASAQTEHTPTSKYNPTIRVSWFEAARQEAIANGEIPDGHL